MRIDVITLFPGMFDGPVTQSILQRAQDAGQLQIACHDLRQFGIGEYRQVDDRPYGGGAGMVLRADVIVEAIETVTKQVQAEVPALAGKTPHRIYFAAAGECLRQPKVEQIAADHEWLLLLCGHYEGIDQRVVSGGWIDEELAIGEYVLTGGELPAMVLIDAVARHIPGVLGKEESAHEESYSQVLDGKREYPHFTRPEDFRGLTVPDVLLSGHHAEIEKWRRDNLR